MIGTDGDPVSSIELVDYIILEADVCIQPYASFLDRAFRQHSDGLRTYLDDWKTRLACSRLCFV